jgi:hypothetical protein
VRRRAAALVVILVLALCVGIAAAAAMLLLRLLLLSIRRGRLSTLAVRRLRRGRRRRRRVEDVLVAHCSVLSAMFGDLEVDLLSCASRRRGALAKTKPGPCCCLLRRRKIWTRGSFVPLCDAPRSNQREEISSLQMRCIVVNGDLWHRGHYFEDAEGKKQDGGGFSC